MAILPCGPSVLDLRGLVEVVTVIRKIRDMRNDLPLPVILPNKMQPQRRLSRDLMEAARKFEMPAGDGLKFHEAYAEAANQGTVVWRMKSQGARAATAEMQYFFQQLLSYESNPTTPHHERRVAARSAS